MPHWLIFVLALAIAAVLVGFLTKGFPPKVTAPPEVTPIPVPTPPPPPEDAPFTLTGVAVPNLVSAVGGTPVHVPGFNLDNTATATMGGFPVTVTFISANDISLLSPILAAGGSYDITVSIDYGGGVGVVTRILPNAVTVPVTVAFTLTDVSPSTVAAAGGTPLTFTGTDFAPGETATLGGLGSAVTFVNTTTATVVSPPLAPGASYAASITVGGITKTLANAVTVAPAFTLTAVTPFTITSAGGQALTVTASGVTGTPTATLGGVNAPFLSLSPLRFAAPALPPSSVKYDFTMTSGGVAITLDQAILVTAASTGGSPGDVPVTIRRRKPGSGPVVAHGAIAVKPGRITGAGDLANVRLFVAPVGQTPTERPIFVKLLVARFNDTGVAGRGDNSYRHYELQAFPTMADTADLVGFIRYGSPRDTSTDLTEVPMSAMPGFAYPPTGAQLANPDGVNGYADAFIVVTDVDDLRCARIMEDTLSVAESRALGGIFNGFEDTFAAKQNVQGDGVTVALDGNNRFTNISYVKAKYLWFLRKVPFDYNNAVAHNYYDMAQYLYAWYIRTGDPEYYRMASVMAYWYRTLYVQQRCIGGNSDPTPFNWLPDGVYTHWILTGDVASQTVLSNISGRWHAGNDWNAHFGVVTNWAGEPRPMARIPVTYLLARRAGLTDRDYTGILQTHLNKILGVGVTNGVSGYGETGVPGTWAWNASAAGDSEGGHYISNFMNAMVLDFLIKYREWVGNDARILPAMKLNLDYLWDTQWIPASGFFFYHKPNDRGTAPQVDINGDFVHVFSYYWRESGKTDPKYLNAANTIFATISKFPHDGNAGTGPFLDNGNTAEKQTNEAFFVSWKHLGNIVDRWVCPS